MSHNIGKDHNQLFTWFHCFNINIIILVSLHDARAKLKIAEETSELSNFENEKSTRSERHRQPDYLFIITLNIKKKLRCQSSQEIEILMIFEGISIEDPPVLNSSDGNTFFYIFICFINV